MNHLFLYLIFLFFLDCGSSSQTAPIFDCGSNWIHYKTAPVSVGNFVPQGGLRNQERAETSNSFTIEIRFLTSNAINNPENTRFQEAFLLAADIMEVLFAPTLASIVVSAGLQDLGPGILGSTGSVPWADDYDTVFQLVSNQTGIAYPSLAQFNTSVIVPPDFAFNGNGAATKALGKVVGGPTLAAALNALNPTGDNDGTIIFANAFLDSFDTDLSDGLTRGQQNFLTIAIHEFGHLLGFVSTVDGIDNAFDMNNPRFTLSVIDMYRFQMAPSPDFVNAPRVVDPTASPHAAYDGQGILVGGFSRGVNQGDGNQASHWLANERSGNLVGMMDPTSGVSELFGISPADDRMFQLMGYQVAGLGANAQLPCPTIFGVFLESHETNSSRVAVSRVSDLDTILVTGYLFRGSNMVCTFNGTIETPATVSGEGFIEVACPTPQNLFGDVTLCVSNDGVLLSNPLQITIFEELCGNEIVDQNEVCDDGNRASGDGCSVDCTQVEEGFDCPSEGGACEESSDDSLLGQGMAVDVAVFVAAVIIFFLLMVCVCVTVVVLARRE